MRELMKLAKFLVGFGAITVAVAAQAAPYTEGFDDVASLAGAGWVQVNDGAPPANPWFQGNSGVFASHSGADDSYVAANYLSSNSGAISNWLITPEIAVGAGATLKFWTRAELPSDFDDGLEVLFSAGGGTDTGSFVSLISFNGANFPADWTSFVALLPSVATGRIAFRYFGDAATADYIGIDTLSVDIGVPAVPEPSTYALMALGVAGLALARRNRRAA